MWAWEGGQAPESGGIIKTVKQGRSRRLCKEEREFRSFRFEENGRGSVRDHVWRHHRDGQRTRDPAKQGSTIEGGRETSLASFTISSLGVLGRPWMGWGQFHAVHPSRSKPESGSWRVDRRNLIHVWM